jgi:hypothetical protein
MANAMALDEWDEDILKEALRLAAFLRMHFLNDVNTEALRSKCEEKGETKINLRKCLHCASTT